MILVKLEWLMDWNIG